MSRTRKDRPARVRLNDKTEPKKRMHSHGFIGAAGTTFLGEDYRFAERCTIDEDAGHRSNLDPLERRPCTTHLGWQYRPGRRPTRQDALIGYWAPARQAERAALQGMTIEYNTAGDIEAEPTLPERHRHSMFGGGWWD